MRPDPARSVQPQDKYALIPQIAQHALKVLRWKRPNLAHVISIESRRRPNERVHPQPPDCETDTLTTSGPLPLARMPERG